MRELSAPKRGWEAGAEPPPPATSAPGCSQSAGLLPGSGAWNWSLTRSSTSVVQGNAAKTQTKDITAGGSRKAGLTDFGCCARR